jgi:pimeloyl-ACP methyl ester carboxylesterase
MAEKLVMPTQLMVGRTSNVLDEDVVNRMLKTMPNAKVAWFDAGHYFLREKPDEFLAVLGKFLAGFDK